MTYGPPADVARRFRRLDAERRLAFVAALWTARGWETRVDDDAVLAEKDGVERRIRVFAPGWFGSPDLDDVDVLVVTEDDGSVRAAAEAQGVRYVTPTDLWNRLLYGLPRPDAERLAQTYLGRSLTSEEGGQTRSFGALSSWSSPTRLGDRLPDPSRLAVAVLVVLLVGLAAAGSGLFQANDAPAPAPTTNGSYTPGNVGAIGATGSPAGTVGTDANLPPGVSRTGLRDVAELANATGTAMEEQGWALRVHRDGRDETVWRMGGREWTQIITASSETVYRNRVRTTFAGSNRSTTTIAEAYGDGERVYQRFESSDADDPRYSRVSVDEATHVETTVSRVETAVVVYLTTSETDVECVGRNEGTDDCFAYRVTATGTPTILSGDVENYTATATVSDAGLVTELRVEYTVPSPTDDGSRSLVHFGWRFGSFGEVDVSEPSWLPEAQSRMTPETSTGSDGTTTETPSPAETTDPKTEPSNATRTASS